MGLFDYHIVMKATVHSMVLRLTSVTGEIPSDVHMAVRNHSLDFQLPQRLVNTVAEDSTKASIMIHR